MKKMDVCKYCRFDPPSSIGKPCPYCVADGREIQTHADQIRNMSNDELAEWLCSLYSGDCCRMCPSMDLCSRGHIGLKEWLNEPADL